MSSEAVSRAPIRSPTATALQKTYPQRSEGTFSAAPTPRMLPDRCSSESSASRWGVAVLSVVVCAVVAVILYAFPGREGAAHSPLLPTINAALNSSAALSLAVGYWLIRQGRREAHRVAMFTALGFSGLFLVTYLVHHAQVGSVPFQGQGFIRVVYYSFLLPHILGAMAIVPLALLTVSRALRERFGAHRRIARITLPLWLFVSVSGVAVYALLYHWPV